MISVSPDNTEKIESLFADISYTRIGIVNDSDILTINDKSIPILSTSIDELRTAWKGTLDGGGPDGS